MGLTLRNTKGSALTYDELDSNFIFLSSSSSSSSSTGSFTGSFTGSLLGTATSASYINALNQNTILISTNSFKIVGSLKIIGPLQATDPITGSLSGSVTGSVQGTASYASTASYMVGVFPLYTYSITLSQSQITSSLFNTTIPISAGDLGLISGKGAKFHRDLTTITCNPFGTPFTASGTFRIRETSDTSIINQISQVGLTGSTISTNIMLQADSFKIVDNGGIYLESSAPITASATSSYMRISLFYEIIDVSS